MDMRYEPSRRERKSKPVRTRITAVKATVKTPEPDIDKNDLIRRLYDLKEASIKYKSGVRDELDYWPKELNTENSQALLTLINDTGIYHNRDFPSVNQVFSRLNSSISQYREYQSQFIEAMEKRRDLALEWIALYDKQEREIEGVKKANLDFLYFFRRKEFDAMERNIDELDRELDRRNDIPELIKKYETMEASLKNKRNAEVRTAIYLFGEVLDKLEPLVIR